MNKLITRRESLKKIGKITAGITVSAGLFGPFSSILAHATTPETQPLKGWIVDGIGQQPGYSIKALTRKVFDAAGGMGKFISKGDVVVLKPNISWAQAPNLAVTTHPEVMEAVIELCQESGAKKVRIADNTIHDAGRCFAVTGAAGVAERTGADLVFPRSSMMKKMNLHGHRLDVWPVFTPFVEADKIINMPVAKVHGLSVLTLGMKNWIGGVGGRRSALHQDIHQSIVDLAQFFKPQLTLIDATRILTANGPSGGNISDVKVTNRLILSNDPVAADTLAAAQLFGKTPEDVPFIQLGNKWGLGSSDLDRLTRYSVSI
ncbi:MAG: DUF362 domain-containing protein [Desulfobacteraceae bacterium]|nr:MAG: DUF362 domain-containing protein [Desulfobacteraceae bacterium]